jgi:sec-independent protein translocase protein TatB
MVREAELEEMEKRWREENERIMRLHPANADHPDPTQTDIGQPDEMPPIAEPEGSQDQLPPAKRPLP